MTFPVGYHSLHPDPSMNFQMNRWFGWVGEPDMLEEMRRVAPRIATYGDWKRRSECAQNLYRFEPGGNHAAQTSRVKDPVEPSPRAKR